MGAVRRRSRTMREDGLIAEFGEHLGMAVEQFERGGSPFDDGGRSGLGGADVHRVHRLAGAAVARIAGGQPRIHVGEQGIETRKRVLGDSAQSGHQPILSRQRDLSTSRRRIASSRVSSRLQKAKRTR